MDTEWTTNSWAGERPVVWEPIRPAKSNLNYWVRSADQRFAQNFGRLLKETGLIASEWVALRELYRPQRWSPVALGQAIGMSKGGGSKLVSRLVAKGLAVKDISVFDRRFRAVGLTQRGRDLVVFLAALEKDTDREFFGSLGNERRFRLTRYMTRLLDSGPSRNLPQWVRIQLKKGEFQQFIPLAKSKRVGRDAQRADALWAYCEQVAMANALGRPAPPKPEWLKMLD